MEHILVSITLNVPEAPRGVSICAPRTHQRQTTPETQLKTINGDQSSTLRANDPRQRGTLRTTARSTAEVVRKHRNVDSLYATTLQTNLTSVRDAHVVSSIGHMGQKLNKVTATR